MVKEMIMKAFIYNIFIAQIRGLPREAGRGRDRWAARRGVVRHSNFSGPVEILCSEIYH
jgi:hypothetical protein